MRMRVVYAEKPPMTISTVMHTLFSGNITFAFIVVSIDDDLTFLKCYTATLLLLCEYLPLASI
jgi:hypothetical protein